MRRWLYPLASILALIVVWQLAVTALAVPSYLLPGPMVVAQSLAENSSYLIGHAIVTATEVLAGFGMSILIGLPIAIVIVLSKRIEEAVYPLLVASQTIPKIAIAPLFVVWFGFGIMPKILISLLIGFFPVVIAAVAGMLSVDPEIVKMLRSMGASRFQLLVKVRLPAAMPSIFSGLKIAATLSVVAAVVGEFVGSNSGLGYVLLVATGAINTPLIFAAIVLLIVMGVVLFYAINILEVVAMPWYVRSRTEELGSGTM